MQTVSTAWKDNQVKTIVSESFVEVSLDITDPDAVADASSQDNGAVYISNTPQVVSEVDKNIVPYSTLEQNLWVLDGSRETIPTSNVGDCGFIGEVLSDVNGGFPNKAPLITISFTKVHSKPIPAITITWGRVYNEFAEDFIVTAYKGDTVIAEKEVCGNKTVKSVIEMDIVNYDRITIAILKWCLPYHRPRVEEIFVGMNKVYSKSDLFEYSHAKTADPVSTSLPKDEVSFSIDNTGNLYNPYNKSGLSKYLTERQEVKTRYGYKMEDGSVEWVKGGTFYLSEWGAPQNGIVADFKARDLLEFLFEDYYDNVTTITSRSLYSIAEKIFLSANLPLNSDGSRKWKIDESLKKIYTSAVLPVDTKANCLLMIANASGCVLSQDREGIISIKYLRPEVPTPKVVNNEIEAHKTAVAYQINNAIKEDGVLDAAWDKATPIPIDVLHKNPIVNWDSSWTAGVNYPNVGTMRFLWNGIDELYVLFELNNPANGMTNSDSPKNHWHNDTLYYYYSLNNGTSKDDYILSDVIYEVSSDNGYTWKSGYVKRNPVIERTIKLNPENKAGTYIGFDVQQNDNPGSVSGKRRCAYTWASTETLDSDTLDFSKLGQIYLSPFTTETSDYSINKFNSYRKPEITLSKTVKDVVVKVYNYTIEDGEIRFTTTDFIINVGETGEQITVDNPLITDTDRALRIGEWVRDYMTNRINLDVDWRSDVRLDTLDVIRVENEYGSNSVVVTDVTFNYNGAFRGKGKGRVM